MGEFRITGGRRIMGSHTLTGAKNAALPLLAASALAGAGTSVLHACPDIADVRGAIAVLNAAGCKAALREGTAAVDASGFTGDMSGGPAGSMRGAIVLLGAALAARGRARISFPGGCVLGERPIDEHLRALRLMGAEIAEDEDFITAETGGLRGARIRLACPSVGATEQVMLAASLAKGETAIANAAREPEIADLQGFLNAMGADVRGAGTGEIVIRGVKALRGAAHRIAPDRIVAGTYLCAAAITGGELVLRRAAPRDMAATTDALTAAGARVRTDGGEVWLKAGRLRGIGAISTGPHPRFPTDMAPQLAALLAVARGGSAVTETIFNGRGGHAAELRKFGADTRLSADGRTVVINGVERLRGARAEAKDLRGGAALVLAALCAEGESVISGAAHVARGYERFEETLAGLGAEIELR